MGKRRKYTREFKFEAVRLIMEKGMAVTQVARDLGVNESLLHSWKRKFKEDPVFAFPGKGRMKPEEEELRRLRRENTLLKQERDILKKAAAYFARESQ